jgi:hypothetical protein
MIPLTLSLTAALTRVAACIRAMASTDGSSRAFIFNMESIMKIIKTVQNKNAEQPRRFFGLRGTCGGAYGLYAL